MPGGYCSVIAQNTQLSGYVNITNTCNCLFIGNVITNWAFLLFEGIVQICAFSILQCTYFDVSALHDMHSFVRLCVASVHLRCACNAGAALGRRKDWVNKRSSGAHSSCQHWWWSTWSTWSWSWSTSINVMINSHHYHDDQHDQYNDQQTSSQCNDDQPQP